MSCFNPRAHTGRDFPAGADAEPPDVSIHAPTRGATIAKRSIYLGYQVSIHAPTRGATIQLCLAADPIVFQSTRPHGARLDNLLRRNVHSTFQSTRPHGARLMLHFLILTKLLFQSTRPHGARPEDMIIYIGLTLFQSTRPHGARLVIGFPSLHMASVSIHAPTRGATECGELVDGPVQVSIHAPTRGATQ